MADNYKIKSMVLALIAAVLLPSCARERLAPDVPSIPEDRVTSIVHYVATVGEGPSTKASLNSLHQYIFETGDQLYIVDSNGNGANMYGILNLVAGAGDPTATFEGDLMCLNDFTPKDGTGLSATLVSKQDKIHETEDGKITATDYNGATPIYASSFDQAIRYYSDFTAESTYGTHSFALEQNSSFLIISVTFDDDEASVINGASTITATIKNGSDVLREGPVSVEEIDFFDQANFVAAFSSTTLNNASVVFTTIGGSEGDISTDADIATSGNVTLQANMYYEISRSHVDLSLFTIQAKEDGTTVTFNYTANGIQYKKVGDPGWTDYNSVSGISLNSREYVQFRGKKTAYNTDNTTIFTADKTCYIYGDIMSLCCVDDYVPRTTLPGVKTFQTAFNNATWIDIPAGRPLRLSATTLTTNCYNRMFKGCTSLTRAPVLPATSIPSYAYYCMFEGCTALIAAPELPATSVANSGYQGMFKTCTSLTTVPAVINGTTGSQACYEMFNGCTSLANAPALPALSVGEKGYYRMFKGCTSLVQAPALPATSIGISGYFEMFMSCSSLVSGPQELPATDIAEFSYSSMFNGCLALSRVPATLPATAGPANCYKSMFYGCISLNHAPEIHLESIGNSSCYTMFFGCTSLTSATGLENALTVDVSGCYQMFKNCGELTTITTELNPTTVPQQAYQEMFSGCAKITEAPDIKATSTALQSCYLMFYGCRRLRTPPPALAVADVANKAFREMFSGCSALVAAPDLSDMESVDTEGCMKMFYGCTNLKTAPELPATDLAVSAYEGMFQNSGLTATPSLLAMTLYEKCYSSMFAGCKYLEGPVVLPAKDLATKCYSFMFDGASVLNSVVCLATTGISTANCEKWLRGVSSTGTFVRPAGVDSWNINAESGIPTGWIAQDSGIDPIFPDDGPFNPEEDL